MLLTLQEQGWIYRGLSDRRYRLCAKRLFGDSQQRFKRRLVESAAPLLLELSERTGLVADLSCFDGERLEVMESAIPTVLRKRYPNNCQIVGQHAACFIRPWARLAWANWTPRKWSAWPVMNLCPSRGSIRAFEQTQHQGFGQRTEGYWEFPVRLPFLIRAVALPVYAGGRLVGSVALHWPSDQGSVERVLSLHMASLAALNDDVQRALA